MKFISLIFLLVFLQACGEKKPVQETVKPNFGQSQNLFDELDKEMEK